MRTLQSWGGCMEEKTTGRDRGHEWHVFEDLMPYIGLPEDGGRHANGRSLGRCSGRRTARVARVMCEGGRRGSGSELLVPTHCSASAASWGRTAASARAPLSGLQARTPSPISTAQKAVKACVSAHREKDTVSADERGPPEMIDDRAPAVGPRSDSGPSPVCERSVSYARAVAVGCTKRTRVRGRGQ
jgi:hypothetical protein